MFPHNHQNVIIKLNKRNSNYDNLTTLYDTNSVITDYT